MAKEIYPQAEAAPVEDPLLKQRIADCIPVALELIKMIADSDLLLGNITMADRDKHYLEIARKAIAIMVEHDIKYQEREFVWQLALQPFEFTKTIASVSLNENYNQAMTKVVGKELADVKLSDLDNILKS